MVVLMDLDQLKAEHPALYAQAVQLGIVQGVTQEQKRVQAHIILGEGSGDMKASLEGIAEGLDPSDPVVCAQHQSASMKASAGAARTADAAGAITGEQPAGGSKTEEEEDVEALAELNAGGAGENGEFF